MKFGKYLILLCLGAVFACTDLDIPPRNILSPDKIFGSKDGVRSQLARLYGLVPMEDFRYYYDASGLFNTDATKFKQQSSLTGEAMGRDTKGAEQEHNSYWDGPYKAIREVNMFLESLPKYESKHLPADYKTYMAEGHFFRAFIYYSLVKRYGGVPLVDKVLNYPAEVSAEGLQLPRASEEAIWDFIASDLDYAIANLPPTIERGRANKYVAAALKSRVMLHAGSIAKYNTVSLSYDGVRVCGIPATRANGYFKAAYDASKVLDGSTYALYKKSWVAGNQTAIATNFASLFLDRSNNPEEIFVRDYKDPESMHSWDDDAGQYVTDPGGNQDEVCPTLDFVEMFETPAFPRDGSGKVITTSGGNYVLYTVPAAPFAGCEGRLLGTVIFPMETWRTKTVEIRRGVWTGTVGAGIPVWNNNGSNYSQLALTDLNLKLAPTAFISDQNPVITYSSGTKTIKAAGNSGITNDWDYGNLSGFYVRKYLNPNHTASGAGKSSQSWIEIRYAEVLLNRAEAAYELFSAGQTIADGGENYRDAAFTCINLIRERAGATQLTVASDLNNIDIVRKERRKELAFEAKTYWDLKRWRILDQEQNNRRYRTLNPFFSTDAEKYFLDVNFQEQRGGNGYLYTFNPLFYYSPIPAAEMTKNPNCRPNPSN